MRGPTVVRPSAFHAPVRKARLLLASLPLFAGLLDNDGTVLECNFGPLGGQLEGNPDWIGKPFEAGPWWNYSEDSRSNILIALGRAQKGEIVDTERLYRKPDGQLGVMRLTLKPLFAPYGQPDAILVTAIDVTERRRATDTASRIAHDMAYRLRNSFTTMRTLATKSMSDPDEESRVTLSRRLSRIQNSHSLTYRFLFFDVPFQDIVEVALADQSNVSLSDYDPVAIPSDYVKVFMLALGELARPDYPAQLSAERRGQKEVRILWTEEAPRSDEDLPSGLSEALVRMNLEHRTQGTVSIENEETGFVWQFDFLLPDDPLPDKTKTASRQSPTLTDSS